MRIFGETPGGQKGCLHLHGAFPYFYVPYDDDLPREPSEASAWLKSLARGLDEALGAGSNAAADARDANPHAHAPGVTHPGSLSEPVSSTHSRISRPRGSAPRRRFVHDVSLVRAKPFYGFAARERLFAKVRLYDPACVTRARAVMLGGGLMSGRVLQPHEAHVSFVMQVMIDYNLHGMDLARVSRATFRDPLPRWPRLHRGRVPARRVAVGASSGVGGGGAGAAGRRYAPVELEYDDRPPPPPPPPGSWGGAGRRRSGRSSGGGPSPGSPPSRGSPPGGTFRAYSDARTPRGGTKPATPNATTPVPSSPFSPKNSLSTVWTTRTVPRDWVGSDEGGGRLARTSNVELELDASVDDLLNPDDVSLVPLATARDDQRLVQSLVPVWEEEARRAAEAGAPAFAKPAPAPRARTARDGAFFSERLREDARRRVAEAAEREEGGAGSEGLTLAEIMRLERGEGEDDEEENDEDARDKASFEKEALTPESAGPTPIPFPRRGSQSRGSRGSEDSGLFRAARRANRASASSAGVAFGLSQGGSQTSRRAPRERRRSTRFAPPDAPSDRETDARRETEPEAGDEGTPSIDRALVVLSQATAAASQGDELGDLLRDFAAGRGGGRDPELRRKSVDASRAAEIAREAETAQEMSRLLAEADDEDEDPVFVASMQNPEAFARASRDPEAFVKMTQEATRDATRREVHDLEDMMRTRDEEKKAGDPESDEPEISEEDIRGTAEETVAMDEPPAEDPTAVQETPQKQREAPAPAARGAKKATHANAAAAPAAKICWRCGKDCSGQARSFSSTNGYSHKSCEPRICFECGGELVGEKGVLVRKRAYAHVQCAVNAGIIPPRKRRRSSGGAETAPTHPAVDTPAASAIADELETTPEGAGPHLYALRRVVPPPSGAELEATREALGVPAEVPLAPFYGDPSDAPARPPHFGGKTYRVPTSAVADLAPFHASSTVERRLREWASATDDREASDEEEAGEAERRVWALRPLRPPPRTSDLVAWLETHSRGFAVARNRDETRGHEKREEKNATPATPSDAPRVPASVRAHPPPSPFHPPHRVSLRGRTLADDAPRSNAARVGADVQTVSAAIATGRGWSADAFLGGSVPGRDARFEAWLDGLAEAEMDSGVAKAGGGRGQSGPAQIGLGGEEADGDGPEARADEPGPRPSSPKYEEQAGYLDHLLFHGCEAHGTRDEDEETREGAQTTQRVEESERNAATADSHPPRPASARRWKPRGRASQVTPPSLAGGASTPASDSVEFRSQGGDAPREGSTTPHLGVMCVEVIGDTRGYLSPDPKYDAAMAIAVCFTDDGGVSRRRAVLTLRDPLPERAPADAGENQDQAATGGGTEARVNDADRARERLVHDDEPTPPGARPDPAASRPSGLGGLVGGDADDATMSREEKANFARLAAIERWGLEDGLPPDVETHAFDDERALFRGFIALTLALDPDVLVGFEVQGESLGFLVDRAKELGHDLVREISRAERLPAANERQDDEYGRLHSSGIYVTGRVVLNLWRILRAELKLQSHTFEACAAAVLKRRLPRFSHNTLSRWARGGLGSNREGAHQRWRALRYVSDRASLVSKMLEQLDLVARTSEQARIFGIDFFSVIFRGSQYRVESMMLRLAHAQNYVAVSPDKEQTTRQPAMTCLPLVMEPESKMYVDPVAVLDFQSLYPSMVIAYNLCYSTVLGMAPTNNDLEGPAIPHGLGRQKRQLGVTSQFELEEGVLPALIGKGDEGKADRGVAVPPGVLIAPNGAMFVPPEVRPGVLPRLLTEILDTRVMVKAALKAAPRDAKARRRALNARQFGLKLIANVTYGYTAAGFSGRMPMAELADAIVQCGRDTLERAIALVRDHPRWRAKVVYGDTDSLFVHMPGRTLAEAHAIGAEIAAAVTADNPDPVCLKLEKVYSPCILQTKKRYVGFAYETPDARVPPSFDAKGIEVVRRDNCPALVKLQRASLKLLFHTRDLSLCKAYVQRQLAKVLAGRVPLRDFIVAKETRLGTYSSTAGATKPPAAIVAEKMMRRDPRLEPKFGERVPYVAVADHVGARLVDMVHHPKDFLNAEGKYRIHTRYYCEKVIVPALHRLFSLVGADVKAWYHELPPPPRDKTTHNAHLLANGSEGGEGTGAGRGNGGATIDAHFNSRKCAACGELTRPNKVACSACASTPSAAAATATVFGRRAAALESAAHRISAVCVSCQGCGGATGCPLPRTRPRNTDADDRTTPDGGVLINAGRRGVWGSVECESLDCPVYFERRRVEQERADAEATFEAFVGGLRI